VTITSTTTRASHIADGDPDQSFTFGHRFLEDSDLVVVVTSTTGVSSVKSLGTHYRVTGAGDATGGSVIFDVIEGGVGPEDGETVLIYNDPPITQNIDYVSGGTFDAESHENALDRLTLQQQRTRDIGDRSLSLGEGEVDGSGAYDANLNRLQQVGTPTASSDATTKAYVDSTVEDALGTSFVTSDASITATGSTTPRTLAARATEVFNVLDYGAAGDGSVDDSTAINATFAAAVLRSQRLPGTTTGGTVPPGTFSGDDPLYDRDTPTVAIVFPPGIYRIDSTITLDCTSAHNEISVEGNWSVIKAAGASWGITPMVHVERGNPVSFRRFHLDGSGTVDIGLDCYKVNNTASVFESIKVSGTVKEGINLRACQVSNFRSMRTDACGTDGTSPGWRIQGCNGAAFFGISSRDSGGNGFNISGLVDSGTNYTGGCWLFVVNAENNGGHGIEILPTVSVQDEGVKVYGGWFEDNLGDGVRVGTHSCSVQNIRMISGRTPNSAGVRIMTNDDGPLEGVVVMGNHFSNNTVALFHQIHVEGYQDVTCITTSVDIDSPPESIQGKDEVQVGALLSQSDAKDLYDDIEVYGDESYLGPHPRTMIMGVKSGSSIVVPGPPLVGEDLTQTYVIAKRRSGLPGEYKYYFQMSEDAQASQSPITMTFINPRLNYIQGNFLVNGTGPADPMPVEPT